MGMSEDEMGKGGTVGNAVKGPAGRREGEKESGCGWKEKRWEK